jgi:hypothetical protein
LYRAGGGSLSRSGHIGIGCNGSVTRCAIGIRFFHTFLQGPYACGAFLGGQLVISLNRGWFRLGWCGLRRRRCRFRLWCGWCAVWCGWRPLATNLDLHCTAATTSGPGAHLSGINPAKGQFVA